MKTDKVSYTNAPVKRRTPLSPIVCLFFQDSTRNEMILLSEPPISCEAMIIHLEQIFPIPLGQGRLLKHHGKKSRDETVGQYCSIASLMVSKYVPEGKELEGRIIMHFRK
jgi:hypothetical protein